MTTPKKPTGEHIRARTQVVANGKGRVSSRDAPTKPMPPLTSRSLADAIRAARDDERLQTLRIVLAHIEEGKDPDVAVFLRSWIDLVEQSMPREAR